jgi:hypothetical protein
MRAMVERCSARFPRNACILTLPATKRPSTQQNVLQLYARNMLSTVPRNMPSAVPMDRDITDTDV